jgi:hypothetical protein
MVGMLTAGVSALGSISGGQSEQAIENANSKTELVNAGNAEVLAKSNAQDVERGTRRAIGNAAADFGAAGVTPSGSPLAVMHDVATQGELSKRLTVYQGELQAKGFAQEAAIAKARGDAAMKAAYFTAGTTLLTGLDKTLNSAFPETMAGMGG